MIYTIETPKENTLCWLYKRNASGLIEDLKAANPGKNEGWIAVEAISAICAPFAHKASEESTRKYYSILEKTFAVGLPIVGISIGLPLLFNPVGIATAFQQAWSIVVLGGAVYTTSNVWGLWQTHKKTDALMAQASDVI